MISSQASSARFEIGRHYTNGAAPPIASNPLEVTYLPLGFLACNPVSLLDFSNDRARVLEVRDKARAFRQFGDYPGGRVGRDAQSRATSTEEW